MTNVGYLKLRFLLLKGNIYPISNARHSIRTNIASDNQSRKARETREAVRQTYCVLNIGGMIPFPAKCCRRLAAAVRYDATVPKNRLVLVPLAHDPVLKSQGTAAFELQISIIMSSAILSRINSSSCDFFYVSNFSFNHFNYQRKISIISKVEKKAQ